VNFCGTGKRRYGDETSALLRLAQAEHGCPSPETPSPGRAYACPLCSGWHLTATTHRVRRPM
jgi:hypothetical protein